MSKMLFDNVYLFQNMTTGQKELLAKQCNIKTFEPGDIVFNEADPAEALFVIKFGSVKIFKSNEEGRTDITTMGAGSHFGEMSFIDNEPRSASADVNEQTDIAILDYSVLRENLESYPDMALTFYRSMAHFMCGRLRSTTLDLQFSRELNLRHF